MSGRIDPRLLELLACPCPHHAPVAPAAGADDPHLRCQRCGTGFPIQDGIPVMLLEAAVPGRHGIGGVE